MTRPVGILLTLAAVALLAACDVQAAWVPQPPWPTRAAQTAVARTATAAARVASPATTRAATATRTPVPTFTPTRTPTSAPQPTRTPTGTPTGVVGGISRPPRRCDQEFAISGTSPDFAANVWAMLTTVYQVSPADYDMVMTCQPLADGRTQTRVRRIVEADQSYSDYTGTLWLLNGRGALAASLLVHEAAHVNVYGWNQPGSRDCGPENRTLERQAAFLARAAELEPDPRMASALRYYSQWYLDQRGVWQCPA